MTVGPRFWPGETVQVRAAFTTPAGAALAVSEVEFMVRSPDGQVAPVADADVIADGPGAFYVDLVVQQVGTWAVRASCSSPSEAVVESVFEVVASAVL